MSDFIEYDPVTGIKTEGIWDENSESYTLKRTADVSQNMDYCKQLANDPDISRTGIKKSWWLYAKIDPIVILQMRAKGIDIFNRDHQERMFQEIDANYPHLKCTTGHQFGTMKKHYI